MRKIDFGMFRMFCIFVMSNITQWRGDLPIRAGIFIPVTLHIRRFRTPVWSVNAPNSASVLLDSGTGGIIFSCLKFYKGLSGKKSFGAHFKILAISFK